MTKSQQGDFTITVADWVSTARAAQLLGITPRWVRKLVDENKLEGRLMNPRFMLISKESLNRYMLEKD